MSNDLYQPDSGDLQPYQPGGDLQPITPSDDWSAEPDYLTDRHEHAFGQLPQQAEANFQQIATVFSNDMARLGFVQRDIDKCVSWFRQSLSNPVQRMPAKNHVYQLWQYSNDAAMNAFANYAATQKFPQALLQSICYWVQQFDDFQHGVGRFANQNAVPVQGRTPTSVEDSLSDADFAKVQAINQQAAARAEGILRDKFGSSYEGNMRVIRDHWNKLSTAEQEHLSAYTTGWVKATNTPEVLLGLFQQAIGSGSIPKDSVSIAREIASYEELMRSDRKRWLAADDLQARYRHLLTIRDGGR